MIYQRFALAVTFGTCLVLAPPQFLGPRAARAEAQQTAPVPTIDVDSLRIVAERGIPGPQVMLGMKYLLGQDVPEDRAEAARWFLRAAEHGFAPAQSLIAGMYRDGDGVTQDDVAAYMWFGLAVAQASEETRSRLETARDDVAGRMTSQQIADVQRLVRERTEEATAGRAARDALRPAAATDRFDKTLLFSKPELERIRSVTVGQFGADPTVALVVAGDHGASFLTRDGVERSFTKFDTRTATPVPLDVDGDGVYEFMDRGGGWQPVGVADAQGGSLWRHDSAFAGDAPNEMAAGDLDGDGLLEFVIGLNGRGGLYLVDDEGREVWRRGAVNVFSVAVVDTDADGTLDIVHSHIGGRQQGVRIRTADGEILHTLRPGFADFSMTPWPTTDGLPHLFGAARGMVRVVNFLGEEVAKFDGAGIGRSMRGSPVQFGGAGAPHFAVVSSVRRQPKSVLHIFAPDGTLVHHETLPVRQLGLGVLEREGGSGQVLVVGGGSEVWTYRPGPH